MTLVKIKCVEYLRGDPFCYMTPTSVKLLNELKSKPNVEIVPLTARTEMEFKRVNLGDFKYVLVTNGGILLRDGVVDQDWYQESLDIVSKSKESLDLCRHLLEIDPNRIFDVKFVNNLYLYAKSANPQETVNLIKKRMDYFDLSINQFRSKVYVFPKGLNKDDSMERCKKVIIRDKTLFADDALYNAPSNDSVDLFLTSDESVL